MQRLEALSGYRHVFPPQDPNARLNPVLFSHLIFSLAGRRCHVLSRVCDAGLDHTQRTNKFAHHVVLDPRELVPGGPAWLLAAPGFMQSTWDGVPKVLPAGRRPPAANSPAAICRAWQQITGDAGWGGALAETASPGANRPAVIIFRPGIDLLPLLAESLALLPPESRWNVSFCTYFSKLPPGIDCQWRCVLEGSPEAIANQRLPGALVIDLAKPLGAAPSSPLVQAARTGVAPLAPASGFTAAGRCRRIPGQRRGVGAVVGRIRSRPRRQPCPHPAYRRVQWPFRRRRGFLAEGVYDFGPPPAITERDGPAAGLCRDSSSENRSRNGRLSEAWRPLRRSFFSESQPCKLPARNELPRQMRRCRLRRRHQVQATPRRNRQRSWTNRVLREFQASPLRKP